MAKDLENTMVGNNVYILTDINAETTNGLIVQLTQWVNNMPFAKRDDLFYKEQKIQAKEAQNKIYSPYDEIPDCIPTLNVWINSGGGKTFLMQSLLSMFHLASACHGVIIKTYNLARACSSSSIIAISGTKGYRFMAEDAYNGIHFGSIKSEINHSSEIEFNKKYIDAWQNSTLQIYLNNTKLANKELNKYYNTEGSGTLYSAQCLEKGLCDWVITNDGRFVNNVNELKQKQR